MKIAKFISMLFLPCIAYIPLAAQDSTSSCKVDMPELIGAYKGECKKGYAHGKGEATGVYHYTGEFKYGLPSGKGRMDYGNTWYEGAFQDGKKEGKGELHYTADGKDSVIKGYWSGDEYRGKNYVTYKTDAVPKFDRVDINPSAGSGHRITIEISTTSSSEESVRLNPRPSVNLSDLIAMKQASLIRYISNTESPLKYSWTFEIREFPIQLRAQLTNGQYFNLDLYKSADWNVKIYLNR